MSQRERAARLGALGIIGGMALANVVWTVQTWPMGDVQIYWEAGERIRNGEPLYPGASPYTSYRYAPWFAWMWAGFTYLPYTLVAVAWQAALLISCVAAAIPFVRRGIIGIAFAGTMIPLLFAVSAGGNVQALMVVSLLYGIDRRSGPLWIGLAASLRATPFLLVVVYAARREWRRFWLTIGLTAVLVVPMLLYEWETLVTGVAGREPGLLAVSPMLWLVIAFASVAGLAVMAWRRSPYTILAAATAAVVASPKLFGYDVTTLAAVNPGRSANKPDGGARQSWTRWRLWRRRVEAFKEFATPDQPRRRGQECTNLVGQAWVIAMDAGRIVWDRRAWKRIGADALEENEIVTAFGKLRGGGDDAGAGAFVLRREEEVDG